MSAGSGRGRVWLAVAALVTATFLLVARHGFAQASNDTARFMAKTMSGSIPLR